VVPDVADGALDVIDRRGIVEPRCRAIDREHRVARAKQRRCPGGTPSVVLQTGGVVTKRRLPATARYNDDAQAIRGLWPMNGRTWKAQAPVRVIDQDVLSNVSISLRTYDVSPDGGRFLVIKDAPGENASARPPQVIVVQNWVEEWKRLGQR
jgi:hypothetical protein